MKRASGWDYMGALVSTCSVAEEHSPRSNLMLYSREYQSMLGGLDEEEDEEESGNVNVNVNVMGKKRRLSVEQVNALEKNFEVENKLEPERKVKLAQDLGLQPRQVAVWFQNRRARWKTKQLERDYGILKAEFDSLQHNYDSLQLHNDSLLNQIRDLNSKFNDENTESNICVKEEPLLSDSANNTKHSYPITTPSSFLSGGSDDATLFNTDKWVADSECDSSAILNEENNTPQSNSSYDGGFIQDPLLLSPNSPSLGFNYSSSSINCFSFTDSISERLASSHKQNNNVYQPRLVKLEEDDFFSGDEACNFFSDQAAPTLHWYSPDQWNC